MPHFGSYAMQGNCYCYCYRQSQRTENTQYQHIIAKWQKVAVSKMPYFAPFLSHFSALFQPVFMRKRTPNYRRRLCRNDEKNEKYV